MEAFGKLFYGLHRPEARHAVLNGSSLVARLYRLSPWGYSCTGALTTLFNERLATYDPVFPFAILGCFLMAQGYFSYMADVHAFGLPNSIWHRRDTIMATILMIVVGPILGVRMMAGYCDMSSCPHLGYFWVAACMLALFCKIMSGYCSRHVKHSIEPFLFWHTGWHVLPCLSCGMVVDMAVRAVHVKQHSS